ncbi:hypothetical protein ACFYWS_00690 [Streptomyces sp. NPDC002795]|uniref:hypothetical protein n=1 Tax=Streptomyces sp. NPDC002795 TaxID=3364665 RepID=UPI00367AC50D
MRCPQNDAGSGARRSCAATCRSATAATSGSPLSWYEVVSASSVARWSISPAVASQRPRGWVRRQVRPSGPSRSMSVFLYAFSVGAHQSAPVVRRADTQASVSRP